MGNSFDARHLHMDGGNPGNNDPARCGVGGYIDIFGPTEGIIPARITSDPEQVTCPDCRQLLDTAKENA